MLKNSTYDLMETASVLSKGRHRYDAFQADAKDCAQCQQTWRHMKAADEEPLDRILAHLKQDLDQEVGAKPVAA